MSINDFKCLIAVPTFRRPHFLPRILACFERLDYDNKKMVIINDDPDTKFIYNDDPRVEVINMDKQLQLSVKRNMFNCWDYDVIFPLDDDDLFLPSRIKNHVKFYLENPFLDLFRNRKNFFVNDRKIKIDNGGAFTNSSYTRKGFFKSGGYTSFEKSNQDDSSLRQNFKTKCECKITDDDQNIDFIYQFEGGRYHNTNNKSVIMDDDMSNKTINQRKESGEILLKPDYETYDNIIRLCEEALIVGELPIQIINNGTNYSKSFDK